MIRTPVVTAVLLAACVPVWLAAGWVLHLLGLEALDLVGRIGLVVLFLSVADRVLAWVGPQPH